MRVRSLVIAGIVIIAASCTSRMSPEADPAASPSPSEVPGAQGVSADDALGVVDDYFAAFSAGDVDGMMGVLADDAVVESSGDTEDPLDRFRLYHEWVAAEGTEIVDRECSVGEVVDAEAVTVRCRYGQHPYLSQAVGGNVVPWTTTFTVGAAGIVEVAETFGQPDFNTYFEPFSAWMSAHHPQDVEATACCGGETVEESRARGALRVEYADLWAAWLQEHPDCTWRDIACQSKMDDAVTDPSTRSPAVPTALR